MKLLYKNKFTETFGWSIDCTISETLLEDYENISSIENWHTYSNIINADYKVIRREIMTLVWQKMLGEAFNFHLLNDNEKMIAVEYFCVPSQLRDTLLTTEQQIELGIVFDEKSTNCRKKRFQVIRAEIFNRMIWSDAVDLLNECKNLVDGYFQGVEGTLEGDSIGLFDYIESRPGTIYENSGLLHKNYQIVGYSNIEDFSDKIMDVLKNGNY